jgi:hypothetical protein
MRTDKCIRINIKLIQVYLLRSLSKLWKHHVFSNVEKKMAKTRTVSEICSKNDLFIKILQICKLLARMV